MESSNKMESDSKPEIEENDDQNEKEENNNHIPPEIQIDETEEIQENENEKDDNHQNEEEMNEETESEQEPNNVKEKRLKTAENDESDEENEENDENEDDENEDDEIETEKESKKKKRRKRQKKTSNKKEEKDKDDQDEGNQDEDDEDDDIETEKDSKRKKRKERGKRQKKTKHKTKKNKKDEIDEENEENEENEEDEEDENKNDDDIETETETESKSNMKRKKKKKVPFKTIDEYLFVEDEKSKKRISTRSATQQKIKICPAGTGGRDNNNYWYIEYVNSRISSKDKQEIKKIIKNTFDSYYFENFSNGTSKYILLKDDNDKIISFLIYSQTKSSFSFIIKTIATLKEYRYNGFGTMLVLSLQRLMIENKLHKIYKLYGEVSIESKTFWKKKYLNMKEIKERKFFILDRKVKQSQDLVEFIWEKDVEKTEKMLLKLLQKYHSSLPQKN